MATSGSKTMKQCPSSRCEDGNNLLGIVGAEGRINFLAEPFAIDATFVETAREGRTPEQRFRFSSPCLTKGCEKWDGERCGVAKVLSARGPELLSSEALAAVPHCAIRATCRWHGEHGDSICAVCAWVVTEPAADIAAP